MIQITAYLRDEEDLKLWKLVGNKAEFLHDALTVQNSIAKGSMYPKKPQSPMEAYKDSALPLGDKLPSQPFKSNFKKK